MDFAISVFVFVKFLLDFLDYLCDSDVNGAVQKSSLGAALFLSLFH